MSAKPEGGGESEESQIFTPTLTTTKDFSKNDSKSTWEEGKEEWSVNKYTYKKKGRILKIRFTTPP